MGTFRLVIEAVGAHGCARSKPKDDGTYYGCNQMYCPDCQFREFVRTMQRLGNNVTLAQEIHWPGQPSEVVDDVLHQKRVSGSF